MPWKSNYNVSACASLQPVRSPSALTGATAYHRPLTLKLGPLRRASHLEDVNEGMGEWENEDMIKWGNEKMRE
jgi:hypothetical protein